MNCKVNNYIFDKILRNKTPNYIFNNLIRSISCQYIIRGQFANDKANKQLIHC